MAYAIAAVAIGAALGALLRWWLSIQLNPVVVGLPMGTLASNLIGGYLVGVAVAYFADNGHLPVEVRLFIVTGFLGGLTTFSTFSAETVTMLMREQYAWALGTIGAHLGGSLVMTVFGIMTVKWCTA